MAWCHQAASHYQNQCWLSLLKFCGIHLVATILYHEFENHTFSSLAPGRFEWNFRWLIFKLILGIHGWGISCEIALKWMSLYLIDDKSTLVQVKAWCRQALNQCWPRSLLPYGVTRPQWVNVTATSPRGQWFNVCVQAAWNADVCKPWHVCLQAAWHDNICEPSPLWRSRPCSPSADSLHVGRKHLPRTAA